MNVHRTLAAAAAAAVLAACSNSPTAPTVASVTVSPTTATLDIGGTQQFTAVAKDADGNTVSGTVTWTSSDEAVTSVSSSGVAMGVASGSAAVTATVSGVAGSAVVTVRAPQQLCTSPTTVGLAVGETQAYALSDCLLLPSGANGDRYRVTVTRPTQAETASDVPTVTLSVTGIGVSQVSPPAVSQGTQTAGWSPIPGLSDASFRKALEISEATSRFHTQLRQREREMIQRIGAENVLPPRPLLMQAPAQATSPASRTFNVSTTCSYTQADSVWAAKLVYENNDLAIYQDSTEQTTKPISVALAKKMADYYSTYARDMVASYFGPPSDIDGNGKVVLLATRAVTGNTAAFVWSGDFFPTSFCPASNEMELMFFSSDLILAMDGSSPTYQALSTVAHEMEHVVSLYHRIESNFSGYHPDWIEEGRAEISGEMSSRIAWAANGGPAVNAVVSRSSFQNSGGIDENSYGVALNLARTAWYLSSQPNSLVTVPDGTADTYSIYGSGWLFERWLGDAYGNAASAPEADAPLFKVLTDSLTAPGTTGLQAQTGKSYDQLFQEFVTAIALHQVGAPEPARPFSTYNFVSAAEIFCQPNPLGVFPWTVTTTGTASTIDCSTGQGTAESSVATASFATKTYSGPIGPSGVRIHDFVSNGTGTGAQVRVDMSSPGQILVSRLR